MGTASLLQALADQDKKIERLVVASSMSAYGEGLFECPKCGFVGTNLRNNDDLDKERWEVPCPKCNADMRPLPTPESKNFQPQFVYSINKRDQEELCLAVGKAYDIETVALRFFSAYGPRQALSNPYTGVAAIFASRLLGEKAPLIFEDGQQTRDFVHVSDVVSSTMQALFKEDVGFQALNVGSGHAVTIEQVARVLQKRLGGPDPEFPQTYRKGDIRHCFPDISRAKEALDWEPKHQLEDGVEDLVEWVASQVSHAEKLDAHVEELRKKGLLGSSR
jgi:dTDP-L-rhamnose 4-epimerase